MEKCICGSELKHHAEYQGNRHKNDFTCKKCKKVHTFYGTEEEARNQLRTHVKKVVATEKKLKFADAELGWGLSVVCPYCSGRSELTDQDKDGKFKAAIFGNRWDDLKNVIVKCDHVDKCGKSFLIDEVTH